jgi:GAF domain-containing protein
LELTACDRGGVWLRNGDGEPELSVRRGSSEPVESLGTIKAVLDSGRAIITHDVAAIEALAKRESVMLGGIRAIACAPLMAAGVVIGALYADSRTAGKVFTELDMELLRSFADHAGAALAAIRVRGEILAMRDAAAKSGAAVALA